jgi:hypothetical protein
MAYKFQLGTARLSGSLVQEGQIKAENSALTGSSLGVNGTTASAFGISVLGAADQAAAQNVMGLRPGTEVQAYDAQLDSLSGMNAGAATALAALSQVEIEILDNATVSTAELNHLDGIGDAAYDQTADSVVFFDATDNKLKYESANDFVDAINGTGLGVSSGTLQVSGSQTLINDILNVNFQAIGTAADQEAIDFTTANEVSININGTSMLTATATGVEIAGNLVVEGASVEIQQGFVVTSSVQFEGLTPDGNQISLTSADPTADRTITLPDLDGHIPLIAGAISNANVTAAEFAVLDGNSLLNTGITVSDSADGFLMNDGGVMKHIRADNLKSYFQSGVEADSAGKIRRTVSSTGGSGDNMIISDDGGVNFFNLTASATAVIDPGFSAGHELNIKCGNQISETVVLTVSGAGGANYTFDGFDTIQLESPNAAIKLILRNATDWMIF